MGALAVLSEPCHAVAGLPQQYACVVVLFVRAYLNHMNQQRPRAFWSRALGLAARGKDGVMGSVAFYRGGREQPWQRSTNQR